MLDRQTLYESWMLRRRRLDDQRWRADPLCRKEQIRILDGLLKEFRDQPEANREARFPASLGNTTPKRQPFAIRLNRPTTPQKHNIEQHAHQRIESVVNHIHALDAQAACSIPKVEFLDGLTAPAPQTDGLRVYTPFSAPARVIDMDSGTKPASSAADVEPEADFLSKWSLLLFVELPELLSKAAHPLRGLRAVARLVVRYVCGMFSLLFRGDRRNVMEYVVDELKPERSELRDNCPEVQKATAELARLNSDGTHTLFMNQRTIYLNEHAVEHQRDKDALIEMVKKVAHPEIVVLPTVKRPGLNPQKLRHEDMFERFEKWGENAVSLNGRLVDSIANCLEHDPVLCDDVLKFYHLNLACASRALHLVTAGRAAEGGRGPLAWAARAASGAEDVINEQVADYLTCSDYHGEALNRFRLELSDGDLRVRENAIDMLSKIGTLDDVGLLLDVSEMPCHGKRLPRERRVMIRAAAKLAERLNTLHGAELPE
jgi:hypothetical protein